MFKPLQTLKNVLKHTNLPCENKIGSCGFIRTPHNRFRFTCLYCRWRREYYTGYTQPKFYIKYVYKHISDVYVVDYYGGKTADGGNMGYIKRADGKPWTIIRRHNILVDPRGHFLCLRRTTIMVFDRLMGLLKHRKPLIEFCEFLANYPTF